MKLESIESKFEGVEKEGNEEKVKKKMWKCLDRESE